jgi:hypothetical protein
MGALVLSDRDQEIVDRRIRLLEHSVPQVGDWIDFADGVQRRISHVWAWEGEETTLQTSDGGHYYLGEGYVSFSGGLFPATPARHLTLTEERRDGWVWIFHHDQWRAHNGVDLTIPCRVWRSSVKAP